MTPKELTAHEAVEILKRLSVKHVDGLLATNHDDTDCDAALAFLEGKHVYVFTDEQLARRLTLHDLIEFVSERRNKENNP